MPPTVTWPVPAIVQSFVVARTGWISTTSLALVCHPKTEEAVETVVEILSPFSLFSVAFPLAGLTTLAGCKFSLAYYNELKYLFDSNFAVTMLMVVSSPQPSQATKITQ
jgi:hypothetical protein